MPCIKWISKQRLQGLYKQFISPVVTIAQWYIFKMTFYFLEQGTEEGMVHLRMCSTKYNLFYTFTKDSNILEGWQGEDDEAGGDWPHTGGRWQSRQGGQCDGRDSLLAPCNKMTVRQTLEIHIGLMTWLHAKLILNNHFAGNFNWCSIKLFFWY